MPLKTAWLGLSWSGDGHTLYISGGKPARLLEALEGSPLWNGFLLARRQGAWLMGCSAGAMALGDWTLVHRPEDGDGTPTEWQPGLGMLQGMAVVPHFDAWPEAEEQELENGHGEFRPYKHTINVKPGEKLSYLVSADTPGRWAYHCHLLYHMEMGMFREVRVP